MSEVFQQWESDPEFQALPSERKLKVYSNYFDKELADDDFRGLPVERQTKIKANFLKSAGLQAPQAPVQPIEAAGESVGDMAVGAAKSVGKQALRFGPNLARTLNQGIGFAGGLLESGARAGKEATGDLWGMFSPYEKIGAAVKKYGLNAARDVKKALEHPFFNLPEEKQKRLWDNPQYLLDPEWLTYNAGDAVQSLGLVIAGAMAGGPAGAVAVGGGMEGLDLYDELIEEGADQDNAASASIAFGIVTGILNKIGVDRVMKKPLGNILKRGARRVISGSTEAATEWAEEPFQAAFGELAKGKTVGEATGAAYEALKNVEVIPGAFIAGGAMAGQGGARKQAEPQIQIPPQADPAALLESLKAKYQAKEINIEVLESVKKQMPELADDIDSFINDTIIEEINAGGDPEQVVLENTPQEVISRSMGEVEEVSGPTQGQAEVMPSREAAIEQPDFRPTAFEQLRGRLTGEQGRYIRSSGKLTEETPATMGQAEVVPSREVEPTETPYMGVPRETEEAVPAPKEEAKGLVAGEGEKAAPSPDLEGKGYQLTSEELKQQYPSIPDEIVNQLGDIEISDRYAGEGKFWPGKGLSVKANEHSLLHEIGHAADNVLTEKQAAEWEQISKEELKKGILGNKPERLAGDGYSIWENLYTAFSIYHRSINGQVLTEVEQSSLKNNPKTYGFIEKNLAKQLPALAKTDLVQKKEPFKKPEQAGKVNKPVDLLSTITSLQKPGQPRDLVSIPQLREKAGMDPEEFDSALVELSKSGKVALHGHDFAKSLPKEEQAKFLKVGDEWFGGVVPKGEEGKAYEAPPRSKNLADYAEWWKKANAQIDTSESFDTWNKARDEAVEASKEAGNRHMDQVPFGVETLRGVRVKNIINGEEGVITTVDNQGKAYVLWEKYPQYPDREGMEMWIGRTEQTEYVMLDRPGVKLNRKTGKHEILKGKQPTPAKAEKPASILESLESQYRQIASEMLEAKSDFDSFSMEYHRLSPSRQKRMDKQYSEKRRKVSELENKWNRLYTAIQDVKAGKPAPQELIEELPAKAEKVQPIPAQEAAAPKNKPGRAWIGGQWRPFTDFKEITRGKNKGWVKVKVQGKWKLVNRDKVKEWPGEKVEAPVEIKETPKGPEVSVDLTKAEEKKLTLKEQKEYLLAEIDKAIEEAPEVQEDRGQYYGKDLEEKIAEFRKEREKLPDKWAGKFSPEELEKADQRREEINDEIQKLEFQRMSDHVLFLDQNPAYITIEVPGDGKFRILNEKDALKAFKKEASTLKPSNLAPTIPGYSMGQPAAAKKEKIDPLYRISGKGGDEYFTDGRVIIKGKPPKNAKYITEEGKQQEVDIEAVKDQFKQKTTKSKILYFGQYEKNLGIAVSDKPVPDLNGDSKGMTYPFVVLENKAGRGYFNQYLFNAIRNRYPNAEFQMSAKQPAESVLLAFDNGEPVAALAPFRQDEESAREVDNLWKEQPPEAKGELGDLKGIKVDPDSLSTEVLSKLNRNLKAMGYDVRGVEDVKSLLKQGTVLRNGVLWHPDWITAYEQAVQGKALKAEVTERGKKWATKAKRHFGTTLNLKEAGYILQDGIMLDLSGKRQGGPSNTRALDHREIQFVLDEEHDSLSEAMHQFMLESGAIRLSYFGEDVMLDVTHPPTDKQLRIIARALREGNGAAVIDVTNLRGSVLATTEMERATPAKIRDFIEKAYKGDPTEVKAELARKAFPENRKAGLPVETLAGIQEKYLKKLKGLPEVYPVQSFTELPDVAQRKFERVKNRVKGTLVRSKGTRRIYQVGDNLSSEQEVLQNLLHEGGHDLIVEVAGPKKYDWFMLGIYAHKKGEISDILGKGYEHDIQTKEGRVLAADEWFARAVAEKGFQQDPWLKRQWDKLVRMVNEGLRKLGIDVTLSEAEIREMMRATLDRMRTGPKGEGAYSVSAELTGEPGKGKLSPMAKKGEGQIPATPGKAESGVITNEQNEPLVLYHGQTGTFHIPENVEIIAKRLREKAYTIENKLRGKYGKDEKGYKTNLWLDDPLYAEMERLYNEANSIRQKWISRKTGLEGGVFDVSRSGDIGIHFAVSPKVASKIAPQGSVIPVNLYASKVIRIRDIFSRYQGLTDALDELRDKEIITNKEFKSLYGLAGKQDSIDFEDKREWGASEGVIKFWKRLNDIVSRKKGLALVYENEIEGGGDSYVVFHPDQIKTIFEAPSPSRPQEGGQEPDISAELGDSPEEIARKLIAEHMAGKGKKEEAKPEHARLRGMEALDRPINDFIYWIVDKNHPFETIQSKLDTVGDQIDVFLKETQRPKRTAAQVKQTWDDDIKPMLKKMAELHISVPDLEEYSHAKHAPEANIALRHANAKWILETVMDSVKGKKATDFKQQIKEDLYPNEFYDRLMDAFKLFGDNEKVQKIKKYWDEFSERPSGMSDDEAAEVLKRYQGDKNIEKMRLLLSDINNKKLRILYDAGLIPDEEYDAIKKKYKFYVPLHREGYSDSLFGASKGLKPSGRAIKVRGGSTRNVVNIFGNSIANLEKAINLAEKARSTKALKELVEANLDPSIWRLKEEKKSPRFDSAGNIRMYPDMFNMGDNEFRFMADGKQYILEVNRDNKDAMLMLRTLRSDDSMSGPIVNSLAKLNRFLARVNTSWSPEFIVSNFARDLQTAGVNIQDTGVKPKKLLRGAIQAVKAIYRVETGKGRGDNLEALYGRFKKAGGKIGWADVHGSVENLSKKLTREIEKAEGKRPVRKTVSEWLQWVENANTAIENGVRLHAFKLATDQGMTDERAAQIASDLTVDFTKKGAAGPVINSLYLFANAGIQGSYRLFRAGAKSSKVRGIMAGIIGVGFLNGLLNAILGGEDDDGEDYFNKIDDFIRERNAIFMVPGTKGKYVKFPLPWGYNFFWNIGGEMSRAFTKQNYKPLEGAGRLAAVFAGAFNPVASGTLLQTIAPTVLDPIAQVAENKNWFGGDLMPAKNIFEKAPTPDSQRYWKSARTGSIWVANQLNRLTGGDKVTKGFIDVSPETLDVILDTAGGSALRFFTDIAEAPIKMIKKEEVALHEYPFLRRVAGEPSEWADSRLYRENAEAVYTAKERLKAYHGTDSYQQIYDNTKPLQKLFLDVSAAESSLRKLRKEKKKAEAENNKDKARRIDEQMKSIHVRFNKRYNDVVKQPK